MVGNTFSSFHLFYVDKVIFDIYFQLGRCRRENIFLALGFSHWSAQFGAELHKNPGLPHFCFVVRNQVKLSFALSLIALKEKVRK